MDNKVLAFRLENFMGFEDTGWLDLKPITLLFGRNSTGKSALIRALLLLRQSRFGNDEISPLILSDNDGTDIGDYKTFVHNHEIERDISFHFKLQLSRTYETPPDPDERSIDSDDSSISTNIDLGEGWAEALNVTNRELVIKLTFGVTDQPNPIRLKKLAIEGEAEVSKDGQKVGQWGRFLHCSWEAESDVWHYESDFMDLKEDYDGIWRWVHLTFDQLSGTLPHLSLPDETHYDNEEGFPDTYQLIAKMLKYFREELNLFLEDITYLGPIRSEPERFYYVPHITSNNVGKYGQHAVQAYLAEEDKQNIKTQIGKWLTWTDMDYRLSINPIEGRPLYEVVLRDNGELDSNLRDVGFGISQALPVIIQSLLAEEGSTIIVEQPELHLHPRAQAELADLFIEVSKRGVRFIIETHSENLLLRLRRRVAETTATHKDIIENSSLATDVDALGLYYIDRYDGESSCRQIQLNPSGGYEQVPHSFRRFFADDTNDVLALNNAARKIHEEKTAHVTFGS